MKQYNIYKTTNLINGKFYWGVHDSIDETKRKISVNASDGKNKGQNNPNSRTNREKRALACLETTL